jgi:cytochrome c5
MSEHHAEMTKTTPLEFVYALLGGLFAPLVAIILIVLLAVGIQMRQVDDATAKENDQAVRDRIKPFGVSLAVDPNVPKVEMAGEQVYNEVCSACHGSGALQSPKFKDTAAWSKRLAQGYDTLLLHAMKGIRSMPARGGEPDLTDLEVARGLVYMANAAGAKFEPTLTKEREPSAAELAKGQSVYAGKCATCHDSGMTGAQKLGDVAAWTGLIKQGKDALYAAAINGSFGGPAKGGDPTLVDADVKLAVDYMVSQAKTAIDAAKTATAKK